jgi:hypothetical protein
MKKAYLSIFLLLPCFIYAEDKLWDIGDAHFFMDTNIMENGSVTNAGFSLNYNDLWSGEIRGRIKKTSENQESDDPAVADSLILEQETVFEFFLLPVQYRSTKNQNSKWRAGTGIYYEYQKLDQKGYFDMPVLAGLGMMQVNSYTDHFSMHLFGPLFDFQAQYDAELFSVSFSGGIVPVFFLSAAEKQKIFPLFGAEVNHSQNKLGSPYFYAGLDSVLFKYTGLTVKYSYTQLKYDVIDLGFDENTSKFFPVFPEGTVVNQSLIFEISALIPIKGMGFRIGYGYMLNFYSLDSGNPVSENKHCLVMAGKKIGF